MPKRLPKHHFFNALSRKQTASCLSLFLQHWHLDKMPRVDSSTSRRFDPSEYAVQTRGAGSIPCTKRGQTESTKLRTAREGPFPRAPRPSPLARARARNLRICQGAAPPHRTLVARHAFLPARISSSCDDRSNRAALRAVHGEKSDKAKKHRLGRRGRCSPGARASAGICVPPRCKGRRALARDSRQAQCQGAWMDTISKRGAAARSRPTEANVRTEAEPARRPREPPLSPFSPPPSLCASLDVARLLPRAFSFRSALDSARRCRCTPPEWCTSRSRRCRETARATPP